MTKRIFLFNEGKISEVNDVVEGSGEKIYFHNIPRNFLELSDELKKLSFLCDGVYVVIADTEMEIFFFKRDSLDLFTKLKSQLLSTYASLPINERLRDFLFEMED